jgi:acyl-CoA synthetase (AMP-forming)/AMP-acid ligase II
MLYSSGTTGAPKGVWRPLPSLEQIGAGPPPFARDIIQIFGLSERTRYLSPAPLYHAAPLRFTLALTACGGVSVIMPKFDAMTALDLLETTALRRRSGFRPCSNACSTFPRSVGVASARRGTNWRSTPPRPAHLRSNAQ